MAKISELIPGRDGVVCTVRLKTQNGILLRPIQKLYPMEVSSPEEIERFVNRITQPMADSDTTPDTANYEPETGRSKLRMTRSGRKVVRPKTLTD